VRAERWAALRCAFALRRAFCKHAERPQRWLGPGSRLLCPAPAGCAAHLPVPASAAPCTPPQLVGTKMSAKILREARAQQAELDLEDAEEEVAALGGQAVRSGACCACPGRACAACGARLQQACAACASQVQPWP